MNTKQLRRKHERRWYPYGKMNAHKLASFRRIMHEYSLVELSKMLDVEPSVLSRYRSGELTGKRL